MKGAARHPVCALLLELHVILDDADDVSLSFEIVDECLGVEHSIRVVLKTEAVIVSTQPELHQYRPDRVGQRRNVRHADGLAAIPRSRVAGRRCRDRE